MRIDNLEYHLAVRVQGRAEPHRHRGTIIECTKEAMRFLSSVQVKASDSILIRLDREFQKDTQINPDDTYWQDFKSSLTPESYDPIPREACRDYMDRLTKSGLPIGTISFLAHAHFGFESELTQFQNDPIVQEYIRHSHSAEAWNELIPEQQTLIKNHIKSKYPTSMQPNFKW